MNSLNPIFKSESRIIRYGILVVFTLQISLSLSAQQDSVFLNKFKNLAKDLGDACDFNTDVFRRLPLDYDNPVQLPVFGMNGKLTTNNTEALTMNFANPTFNEAIDFMGPKALRFPGGTVANSYQSYSTQISMVAMTREVSYYLDRDDAIDTPTFPAGTGNSYLYPEGMNLDKDSYLAETDGLIGISENNLLCATSGYTSVGAGAYVLNNGQQQPCVNVPVVSSLRFNYLSDFITLTQEQEITPFYVLRIFDPLYYVVAEVDENSTPPVVVDFDLSPLLADEIGWNSGDNFCSPGFYNPAIALIEDKGRQEVRRQLVKYVYEYFKYFDPGNLGGVVFAGVMDDIDANWNDFVLDVQNSGLYAQLSEVGFHFELGNEIYADFIYKYLPNDYVCSNVDHSPNVDLYVDICQQALQDINSLLPNAEVGAVLGNRDECNWNDDVLNYFNTNGFQFDPHAYILHYYSRYGTTLGNSFAANPQNLSHDLIASPLNNLKATMNADHEALLDGENIWITEYNVRFIVPDVTQSDSDVYLPYTSWIDLMAKLNMFNQFISRNPIQY